MLKTLVMTKAMILRVRLAGKSGRPMESKTNWRMVRPANLLR